MLLFRSEQHVDRWCKQWYRENVIGLDGKVERKRRTVRLGPLATMTKGEAEEQAAKIVVAATPGSAPVSSDLVVDFLEQVYLPHIQQDKKSSTARAYRAN